jgi:hypothetical protein
MNMNQTKKRLQIIKLAISIGDTETIQLQMLKLSPLKSDIKVQEILAGLQAENYAQTQALITEYIDTPIEEIIQRTTQNEPATPEEEEAIIEEFDLFRVKPEKEEEEVEEVLDLDLYTEKKHPPKKQEEEIDYDTLLNLKSEDILSDNIKIKQTVSAQEDDFFDHPDTYNYTEVIEKDDFFEEVTAENPATDTHRNALFRKQEEQEELLSEREYTTCSDEASQSYTSSLDEMLTLSPSEPEPQSLTDSPKTSEVPLRAKKHTDPAEAVSYDPIPYIDQKFKNMLTQYPPLETTDDTFSSVDAWLLKISKEGYTEKEIEETIAHIRKLSKKGAKAEAAQLLLISAATHSSYAQFMLARSLFKGDVLKKNLPEAFTIINRLAMDEDYPEAICDLAQLYENGIGITKDKKQAEMLYKEAMELGIQRAAAHYKRVHQANKSFFAKLFRR